MKAGNHIALFVVAMLASTIAPGKLASVVVPSKQTLVLIPGAGTHMIGAHAPPGSQRQSAVDTAQAWVGKNGSGLSSLFVPTATYTNVAGMLGADKPATTTTPAECLVVVPIMVQNLTVPVCYTAAQLRASPKDTLVWCTGAALEGSPVQSRCNLAMVRAQKAVGGKLALDKCASDHKALAEGFATGARAIADAAAPRGGTALRSAEELGEAIARNDDWNRLYVDAIMRIDTKDECYEFMMTVRDAVSKPLPVADIPPCYHAAYSLP